MASNVTVVCAGEFSRFWQLSIYHQSTEPNSLAQREILDDVGNKFLFVRVDNRPLGEEENFGKLIPEGFITELGASERGRLGISEEEFLRYSDAVKL